MEGELFFMKVVSVINYKGGVGKTTLTANLGAYAALKGYKVLLIDLDPQTSLTFSFMLPEHWEKFYADGKTLKDFFMPIIKKSPLPSLSSLVIHLHRECLPDFNNIHMDLISSHLGLIDIDIQLSSGLTGTTKMSLAANHLEAISHLTRAFEEVRNVYDLVLIDCPPNFSLTVKNAPRASDYYIVPTKLDYLSTLGTRYIKKSIKDYEKECLEYVADLGKGNNIPFSMKMLGVVPMMVDIYRGETPIKVQEEYLSQLRSEYHVFQFVRNNSSLFGVAPKNGKLVIPAVLTHPKLSLTAYRIVNEIKQLGDEFLSALKEKS